VALVRTYVSEELITPLIKVTRIVELGIILFLRNVLHSVVIANAVLSSPILITLLMEAIVSSETSVLTRGTRRNGQADDILHIHHVITWNLIYSV
jgi:hypothetical protein